MSWTDIHRHFTAATDFVANFPEDTDVNSFSTVCLAAAKPEDWLSLSSFIGSEITSPEVFVALGLHPWYVETARSGWDIELKELLQKYPQVQVGECGLDYACDVSRDKQLSALQVQIVMAIDLQRILVLHGCRAWTDLRQCLQKSGKNLSRSVLLHSYDEANADFSAWDFANVYFSFGWRAVKTVNNRAWKALETVPEERLLLESDAATTAQAQEIWPELVTRVANLRGMTVEYLEKLTSSNARNFLQFSQN